MPPQRPHCGDSGEAPANGRDTGNCSHNYFFVIIAKNIQKQVIVQLFQLSHLAGGEDGAGTSLRRYVQFSLVTLLEERTVLVLVYVGTV